MYNDDMFYFSKLHILSFLLVLLRIPPRSPEQLLGAAHRFTTQHSERARGPRSALDSNNRIIPESTALVLLNVGINDESDKSPE
jgi:hypothetical protein